MSNILKPEISDYADIQDYFVALDEYFAAQDYVGMTVTAA